MDISDRIESRDPLAIPEHLVFAFDERIAEQVGQACEQGKAVVRTAVTKAVHIQDAFAAGSLMPAQLAELAEGAAKWMEPRWPEEPADADEVARLLGVSRELLELRDRALAAVADDDNSSRVVMIESGLREVLRSQTLAILEFTHDRFDEARDLEPSQLLVAASIFRDAIAVLDIIGWVAGEQDQRPARVTMTRGHLAELQWLRPGRPRGGDGVRRDRSRRLISVRALEAVGVAREHCLTPAERVSVSGDPALTITGA